VSRWETGSNMPDMDILIELSDFYSVDLREILDGERRADKMDKDVEETVLKVSEYEKEGKKKDSTIVIVYSSIGIAALITHVIVSNIDMPDNFATGFIKGLTFGLALGAMLLSIIYATGTMAKMNSFKKRLISRQG
jgi:transcriptional regulator with XRE-family HTH domain